MDTMKRVRNFGDSSRVSIKKLRHSLNSRNKQKVTSAWIDLILYLGNKDDDDDVSVVLEPGQPYTVGRSKEYAQIVIDDPHVSKQHCQLLFDASSKKLYLLNGALLLSSSNSSCSCSCAVENFRDRLLVDDKVREKSCLDCTYEFKASLNGVFVNGARVSEGLVLELCVGDEVMLACASRSGVCGSGLRDGFIVRRIVFQEEVVIPGCRVFRFERPRLVRPLLSGKISKRVFPLRVSDSESLSLECDEVVGRAKSLSAHCRRIMRSTDPVSYLLGSLGLHYRTLVRISKESKFPGFVPSCNIQFVGRCEEQIDVLVSRVQRDPCVSVNYMKDADVLRTSMAHSTDMIVSCQEMVPSQTKADVLYAEGCAHSAKNNTADDNTAKADDNATKPSASPAMGGGITPVSKAFRQKEFQEEVISPPVKNFYLNRLENMHQSSFTRQNSISLPELLHPVDSISRIFIATFTSDIRWFLSYCDIPSHMPVTVACHSTERCWSNDPENRSCVPYPDFPNVIVVYPPFPEAIAFGNDRKRQGVGCHHPKLLVLQREDFIRVIISSANLVAKQWNNVTNTIWWQDFPCVNIPDWTSLFNRIHSRCEDSFSKSDFAAQLAGFMAMLLTDVPSQAYWIAELTKYNFIEANAYLVASVPGIHSYRSISTILPGDMSKCKGRFFGSVEASVVGLSHLFRTAKDAKGIHLKRLAAYLGKSSVKGDNMSEIIFRRDKNVPADSNAVSVLVPNPMGFSNSDCVQLGFLPRTVAKWVAPLWDSGIINFFGFIFSQEALAAAFGENNKKVRLILHISQGPNFHDIPKMLGPEHVVAFCSLITSIQRCTGVWRLEEVLHQYKWPEHLESDFIYGASSIGTSVNAEFLATFSAAAGKRSEQLFDSEESDPEWGRWTARNELNYPSIRIIFPTLERVKSAHSGILPSKHVLCFPEKAWQRLKTVDILHDAIPHPSDRVGYPMHVKVARRRFQSKANSSSFGWIYCGSHNMSAAAWGREISGTDKDRSSDLRLHVCNYELGIIFVFPPPEAEGRSELNDSPGLDDIQLPFVVPAPKYGPTQRPATMRAMSEAMLELAEKEGRKALFERSTTAEEVEMEEVDDEEDVEDVVRVMNYVAEEEEEEERAYADELWSQVEVVSSQSC